MSNYVYIDRLIKTRKIYRRISLVTRLVIGFILALAMASSGRFIGMAGLCSIRRLGLNEVLSIGIRGDGFLNVFMKLSSFLLVWVFGKSLIYQSLYPF